MDFSLSPKAQSYLQRLSAFMQEHVVPAEREYCAQLQNLPDWRGWKQPFAPISAKPSAICRPSPMEPPETMATRPVKSKSCLTFTLRRTFPRRSGAAQK
jgi:hypothetical protein